jgi:hypothetical protein
MMEGSQFEWFETNDRGSEAVLCRFVCPLAWSSRPFAQWFHIRASAVAMFEDDQRSGTGAETSWDGEHGRWSESEGSDGRSN